MPSWSPMHLLTVTCATVAVVVVVVIMMAMTMVVVVVMMMAIIIAAAVIAVKASVMTASRGGIDEKRVRAAPGAAAGAMDGAKHMQRDLALLQQQGYLRVA